MLLNGPLDNNYLWPWPVAGTGASEPSPGAAADLLPLNHGGETSLLNAFHGAAGPQVYFRVVPEPQLEGKEHQCMCSDQPVVKNLRNEQNPVGDLVTVQDRLSNCTDPHR